MAFFNSAARRLAWQSYERVSVAMICRDARSSRYTFYRRFPSRPAFEYALVLVTFREMTKAFNRETDPNAWKDATPQAIIYRLVDEIIASTMTVPTLGVTQLAIRIAMSKPKGARPYIDYREVIIDRAAELLAPKLDIRNPKEAIRAIFQMVLAIATDEAWRHGIPFKTKQKLELAETYSDLILGYFQLRPGKRDPKDFGIISPPDRSEFPEDLQIAHGVYKPSLRRYERAVNRSRKPLFRLDHSGEVLDALILETWKENLKTEKPMKRTKKPKRIYRMI
jgi:AcrR family transcriptional regulator